MKHSDENPEVNPVDGTPPSDYDPTKLNDCYLQDDKVREALQKRRAIAMQMFSFMKEHPWLSEDPDKWVIGIMEELRPAAANLLDFDKFRIHLLKTGAAIFAAIEAADKLNIVNGGVINIDLN